MFDSEVKPREQDGIGSIPEAGKDAGIVEADVEEEANIGLFDSEVKPREQDGIGSIPEAGKDGLFDSEVKPREQDGIGSSSIPLSVLALTKVNARFSVQLTGTAPTSSTSFGTWPDGSKTENERQISSFADKLTSKEDVAIFDTLKRNKEENKILCSNSKKTNL